MAVKSNKKTVVIVGVIITVIIIAAIIINAKKKQDEQKSISAGSGPIDPYEALIQEQISQNNYTREEAEQVLKYNGLIK